VTDLVIRPVRGATGRGVRPLTGNRPPFKGQPEALSVPNLSRCKTIEGPGWVAVAGTLLAQSGFRWIWVCEVEVSGPSDKLRPEHPGRP